MDRIVAVKVLLPRYAKEKDGVQRFLREARAIARLNHPNIVSGIDAGVSNGTYYYVMEYLDGEPLDRRIGRRGRLPWREAVSILRQMAAALQHAHDNGLVHRDIKPANILLAKDGTAKLADLGMARFAGQEGMTLTQTGFVVGTPYYMAPEQARGERDIDIRGDLYSLGITFYEMIAGEPPYTGTDPLVVLNRHLRETVRFRFPDIPAELATIGHRLTERDRARRYPTPAALLEDLDAFEQGRPLARAPKTLRSVPPVPPRPGPQVPFLIAGAAGLFAVLLAAGVAFSGKWGPAGPPAGDPPRRAVSPAPPRPQESARERPLSEADRAAVALLARIRQYEAANPGDIEEIAAQYEAGAAQGGGTACAGTLKERAEETRRLLARAVAARQALVTDELGAHADLKEYGAALETIDRHARDFRAAGWSDWISRERTRVETALAAEAKSLRDASGAAEARGDFPGAAALMKTLAALGVPALAREAAERTGKLETARRAVEAETARKTEAENARLEAFLEKADGWAAERSYPRIEASAPALEMPRTGKALEACLDCYRAAREVFDAARRHALALQGKTVNFTTRGGQSIAGRVAAVQEIPPRLLVGEKACDLNDLSTASVVGLYKTAAGDTARADAAAYFAILDGDPAIAAEILGRTPVELPPRLKRVYEEIRRKAAEEARRAQEEREAARARKETAVATRKPDGPPREILVCAADLPREGLSDEFEVEDEPSSPGGKMIRIRNDGDPKEPPPASDVYAIFKVQVHAGVPYRCWIHMKAGKPRGESQANLLFVQFTNAVDRNGREIHTLGTGEYIVVRAAREGWAWVGRDLSDPKSAEPAIYFRTSGEVTVRISPGMEGVGFDQFVLSPAQYLARPPPEAAARAKR